MISSALIPLGRDCSLDSIEEHLRRTVPFECSRVEWVGHSVVIPQVRVETPVPLTIQIDADDYVPEECRDMADDAEAESALPGRYLEVLRRCTARLDVQSADYRGNREVTPDGNVIIHARTDLDPETPEVRLVLMQLAAIVSGPVLDCVNGEWLLPPSDAA